MSYTRSAQPPNPRRRREPRKKRRPEEDDNLEDTVTYRIAINGFGRIGRNYLRVLLEQDLLNSGFQVAAINDLGEAGLLAHLLEYDSTFGRLGAQVGHENDVLSVGRHSIPTFSERRPDALP
jgi:glyceraldehyde 3-phosphate dehydrogenase